MDAPARVVLVSVEGNIGAGKSTLLRELQRRAAAGDGGEGGEHAFDLIVVPEPIEEWTDPVLPEGVGMLQAYYDGIGIGGDSGCGSGSSSGGSNNALAFQMFAMLTRVRQIEGAMATAASRAQRPTVVVTERGPWSDAELFGVPMRDAGLLTPAEWHAYWSWFCHVRERWRPDATVYLRSTPDVSAARVRSRSRPGEEAVDVPYLERLHAAHDAYVERSCDPAATLRLDADLDGDAALACHAADVLRFVRALLGR
jgi:deoxyadenosine/deoxycytidine kinase